MADTGPHGKPAVFDGPGHSCRWKRCLPWGLARPPGTACPFVPTLDMGAGGSGQGMGWGCWLRHLCPKDPSCRSVTGERLRSCLPRAPCAGVRAGTAASPPSRDHRADVSAPLETRASGVCLGVRDKVGVGRVQSQRIHAGKDTPPLMVVGGEVAQELRRGEEQWAPQWDVSGLHQVLGVRGWWVCRSQSLENLQGPQWYGSFYQWYSCLTHMHHYFHRNNSVSLACVLP